MTKGRGTLGHLEAVLGEPTHFVFIADTKVQPDHCRLNIQLDVSLLCIGGACGVDIVRARIMAVVETCCGRPRPNCSVNPLAPSISAGIVSANRSVLFQRLTASKSCGRLRSNTQTRGKALYIDCTCTKEGVCSRRYLQDSGVPIGRMYI